MRMSGTEPSSVFLSQTKRIQKLKMIARKCQKQAEAKRDGVINQQNYNFNLIWYGKFWCSQNATNQPKSTVELGYMYPRRLTGPPAVVLTKENRESTKGYSRWKVE